MLPSPLLTIFLYVYICRYTYIHMCHICKHSIKAWKQFLGALNKDLRAMKELYIFIYYIFIYYIYIYYIYIFFYIFSVSATFQTRVTNLTWWLSGIWRSAKSMKMNCSPACKDKWPNLPRTRFVTLWEKFVRHWFIYLLVLLHLRQCMYVGI
jgi:hypothetical protein